MPSLLGSMSGAPGSNNYDRKDNIMARPSFKNFTVEGAGPFPLDMLRYDSAHPRTETDANKAQDAERGRRTVTVTTWSPNAPTVRRWESFGWRVVPTPDEY